MIRHGGVRLSVYLNIMTIYQYREVPCFIGGGFYQKVALFEMLEPYDGKLSCTVLRGESGRKAGDLPGAKYYQ